MLSRVFFLFLIFLLTGNPSFSQNQNKVTVPEIEQKMIRLGLVNLKDIIPDILVDLKYSTKDNFIGKDVYGAMNNAYLQPEMARKLAVANVFLQKLKPGYRLLIYDAARPNSAQFDLWNALDALKIPAGSKTMYVADPKKGSNHNFGCAVDLTLADENGKPLDMGTKFDYFGPLAYPRKEAEMLKTGKLTNQQVENRKLLRKVMNQAGFITNTTEWWHFDGMSKSQARAHYGMIP